MKIKNKKDLKKIKKSFIKLNERINKFLRSKELIPQIDKIAENRYVSKAIKLDRKTVWNTRHPIKIVKYQCTLTNVETTHPVAIGVAYRHLKEQLPLILGVIIAKARALRKLGWAYRKGKWIQTPKRFPKVKDKYERKGHLEYVRNCLKTRGLQEGLDFEILRNGLTIKINGGKPKPRPSLGDFMELVQTIGQGGVKND